MQNIPKLSLCLLVRYGNSKIWYPPIRYTSIKLKGDIIRALRSYYNDYYCNRTDSVILQPLQCNYCELTFVLRTRKWIVDGVVTAMPLRTKDLKESFSIRRQEQTIHFVAVAPLSDSDSDDEPDTAARPDYLHTNIPTRDWYSLEVASMPTAHRPSAQTLATTGMHPPETP